MEREERRCLRGRQEREWELEGSDSSGDEEVIE